MTKPKRSGPIQAVAQAPRKKKNYLIATQPTAKQAKLLGVAGTIPNKLVLAELPTCPNWGMCAWGWSEVYKVMYRKGGFHLKYINHACPIHFTKELTEYAS